MIDGSARRIGDLGRALAGLAGLGLFASLFVTWSRLTLNQLALLAVAAHGSLTGVAAQHDAWSTYAGVAVALALAAALIAAAAVADRPRLLAAAGAVALAALIFTAISAADPPSALPGRLALPTGDHLRVSTGGAGEMMAVVACAVALVGLVTVIAAEAGGVGTRRAAADVSE